MSIGFENDFYPAIDFTEVSVDTTEIDDPSTDIPVAILRGLAATEPDYAPQPGVHNRFNSIPDVQERG
jgi:hypothetical protein